MLSEAEQNIAQVAGVKPEWVFLFWGDRKSPLMNRYSPRAQSSDIFLVSDEGEASFFHDRSEIFRRGDVVTPPSVSLYVRMADDSRPDEAVVTALRDATFVELERSGKASNEV